MICFSSLDTVLNKSRFWRFFGKLPFRIPLFTRDVFSYVRSWTMLIRGINQCMNYNGSTKFKPNMLGICGNFLSVLSNVYQISSLAHAVFEGIFFSIIILFISGFKLQSGWFIPVIYQKLAFLYGCSSNVIEFLWFRNLRIELVKFTRLCEIIALYSLLSVADRGDP